MPGGFLLALAALRWRRPEARLLLGLSIVPHSHTRYELLPLFLIVACLEEGVILAALTILLYVLEVQLLPAGVDPDPVLVAKLMTWCIYLPCLIMVLKRQNVAPGGIDRQNTGEGDLARTTG